MYGKVGISIGYVLLKNKILDNISDTYDFLKEECEEQKRVKYY